MRGADRPFMRMLGLGLMLAVLADATLVRMVLVPAFMHVLGQWNWWAPSWLARLHRRLGLEDGHGAATAQQPIDAGQDPASKHAEEEPGR